MHKELIIKVFDKAKEARMKKGDKKPSIASLAKDVSDFIYENQEFSLGERSLRDYRKEALRLINSNEDISIKQFKVVHCLCNYLGFKNYENFTSNSKTSDKNNTQKLVQHLKRNWVIILVGLFCIVVIILINSINKQRWMIWDEDHYIEVKFDPDKYSIGKLKLYKEERIENFKKITVDCNTSFFNVDGSVKIWYGKNIKGELECFTSLGLHPETGKTLKPITKYMIEKYFCSDDQ